MNRPGISLAAWRASPLPIQAGPPLVVLPGPTARPQYLFEQFSAWGLAHGRTVLVPHNRAPQPRGPQQRRHGEEPVDVARALRSTIREIQEQAGLPHEPVDVLGFSGGAQLAHHFALFFPNSVRRLAVTAAGWYTYLDPDRPFPHGLGLTSRLEGHRPDADGFLRLPICVLVGERDVKRDALLAALPACDAQQGPHRLARAYRWYEHLVEQAARHPAPAVPSFGLLPATGHSARQAVERGGLVERAGAFFSAELQRSAA